MIFIFSKAIEYTIQNNLWSSALCMGIPFKKDIKISISNSTFKFLYHVQYTKTFYFVTQKVPIMYYCKEPKMSLKFCTTVD